MAAKKTQSNKKVILARSSQASNTGRLSGKTAVVTGASSGIGFAIARTLAAEDCNVVLTGRSEDTLASAAKKISAATPRNSSLIVPQVCDVRDPQSVGEMFKTVKAMFGRLDILVNNAGITQPVVSVEQTSLELWRDVIDTNLTGVFLCTRAALPLMKAGATIVNNISAAARQVFPNYATYSAAKRGALGFTMSLREELIPRGIRVMALMPGATATDMWDRIMPNAPRDRMIDPGSVAQAVLYAVLLPANVNPSEISLDPAGGAL